MELEQLEALALAQDRDAILSQLIPGTEDYYFHRCLEHLHRGEFEATPPLFEAWVERHGETARVRELRDRRALLRWDRDPGETAEHIRKRLGLSHTHQREVEDAPSTLATRLDPALISRERLRTDALQSHQNLDGFEDRALGWLAASAQLELHLLRSLLQRLTRPDVPGLVEHVARELDDRHSSGWGSFAIHGLMTLAQLDALALIRPSLRTEPGFVELRLARMRPGPEVDLDDDDEARARYLAALWGFVEGLVPAFNSLRALVLYHQLELERRKGHYDRASFERYIRIPRDAGWASASQRRQPRELLAELGRDYQGATGLSRVGDDGPLVRDYLDRLFADPSVDDHRVWAEWLDEGLLRRWFAEAKIFAGQGDAERWYSLLDDAGYYRALEQRVAINLAPDNPRRWAVDAPVELLVDLEQVPTLVVKVFEINALAYFLAHGREVDQAVDLDGLVANDERVLEFDSPALRRVRATLRFPELTRPGTYVIELIGAGKSSRAVIRKGALRYVDRRTAAGHALTVIDSEGVAVAGEGAGAGQCSAWFGGREWVADAHGEIRIPYSDAGPSTLALRCGSLVSVLPFTPVAESYELSAGIHVGREQLIAGATAEVLVSATLLLAGVRVDVGLVREPTLTITSTDRDQIRSSMTVPMSLSEAAEWVHTFKVPDHLRRLEFVLAAKVRSVTGQRDVDLHYAHEVAINQLDEGSSVADLHLRKTAGGHVLQVLGKSGEPRAGVEVGLNLGHLDFRSWVMTRLQTDADGRIELGELTDIGVVTATLPDGRQRSWELAAASVNGALSVIPEVLHTVEDRDLLLPSPPGAQLGDAIGERVSLLERRGSGYVRDCGEALRLSADGLHVEGLTAGDYALHFVREGRSHELRVGSGPVVRGWATGVRRQLELTPAELVRVVAVERLEPETDQERIEIRVAGHSPSARVHVWASRFVGDHDPQVDLDHARRAGPRQLAVPRVRSSYLSGRDIGDEYRYILDRRRIAARPGTMLERPGLLLNPWALRTTSTSVAKAASGGAYASAMAPMPMMEECYAQRSLREQASPSSTSLDFLATPSWVGLDRVPDGEGRVSVARAELGDASVIRVVVVDVDGQAAAELCLPEAPIDARDRRLMDSLDPEGRFVLRKQRSCLAGAAELAIDDLRTAKLEAIDSLAKAHALLLTLSHDETLREWEWLTRWPSLSPEDQRERYAKYACHELHLFLARKDPEFFAAVVEPYLANKRDQTFLDRYLLGGPLDGDLELWAYARLNTLEKILLAERQPGARGSTARHLRDRNDLQPPNVAGDNAAFDTALQGSALAKGGGVIGSMSTRGGGGEPTSLGAFGGGGAPPPPPSAPAPSAPQGRPAPKRRAAMSHSRTSSVDDEGGPTFADMADMAAREEIRRFYQALDKTQEWAENNYYRRRLAEQGPELIGVNRFWREFAEYVAAGSPGPFLSSEFVHATAHFTEMLCALAVLDLPFEAGAATVEQDGAGGRLRADTPMIVFHQQIAELPEHPEHSEHSDGGEPDDGLGVLVSQSYFRADDRYRFEGNERHDKYVRGELLVHTVYLCQLVLTNPSSSALELDLLVQIPQGAIPVANGWETRDLHVYLPPRGTEALEYAFYFPTAGLFSHFPVHVARREQIVARAETAMLEVVTRLRSVDTQSWSHVSQHGSDAELLAYLDAHNLDRLPLQRIAWRMRERGMFDACLALLRARRVYEPVLWSYALVHRDPIALGEFLRQQGGFLRGCGLAVESSLVRTDPVERGWYQHLEYAPLVNARAHPLGRRRTILNGALEAQYRALLDALIYLRRPSDDHWVAAAYYALVQDRVGEAIELLARVDDAAVSGRLQWDYLRAYVAVYQGELEVARGLCEGHREHPVPRWRRRFEALLEMLAEAQGTGAGSGVGTGTADIDEDDRRQHQDRLAASEGSFDFEIEGDQVVVTHAQLASCELHCYRMDIELLFSRQPFMQDQSDRFAIVQPNHRQTVALAGQPSPVRITLPAELRSANSIVELVGAGVRRTRANYAHGFAVRVIEQYGQLRVDARASGRPVAGAYVKVYARKPDGTDFYKDGYTDLRGAFDYASLSTNELDRVERFAILVSSEEHGAVIREAAPPRR